MTKIIYAHHGEEILVDDWNYDLLNSHKWSINGAGYAGARVNGVSAFMHRILMNAQKGEKIDHINRNKLDNQENNLRRCNNLQNNANCATRRRNKSGYKGVVWSKIYHLWVAYIRVNRKTRNLGSFISKEDAACAYDNAARNLFGEFAVLNFPDEHRIPAVTKKVICTNTSGFAGAHYHKRDHKYYASCGINHRQKYLGAFDTAEEAASTYDAYVISIGHPEFANTNLRKVGYQND